MKKLPLTGVTVVDLSRLIPGPFCTLVLSDCGADVIKIEDPVFPDYLKNIPPLAKKGDGILYQGLNRGKKIVPLSIKSDAGQKKLITLLRKADILVESYRPGVLKRLGLDPSSLKKINPKLIIASISGFGQTGPLSQKAGHDLNYQSLSGVLQNSQMPSMQWADLVGGGLWGAFSIVLALFERTKTKKGCSLDISMTDGISFLGISNLLTAQAGVFGGKGLLTGLLARYRLYQTADALQVSLAALEDKFWNQFCEKANLHHLKTEETPYPDAGLSVHRELEQFFVTKTRDEWTKWASGSDFCLTPVMAPQEFFRQDFVKKKGFFHKKTEGGVALFYPTVPLKRDGVALKGGTK